MKNNKKVKQKKIIKRSNKKKIIKRSNKKNMKFNKTRKNKRRSQGGSSIYNDGEITYSDETYNGEDFFRKTFYYTTPPTKQQEELVLAENTIVEILMKNPHPNIVKYFTINKYFVDMEELDINDINIDEVKVIMRDVKDFLQSLGIMYIDWKIDNIGRGKDGAYKLFDFDVSGVIDINNNEWIVKPQLFWIYKKANENGFTEPKQIDDWSFENNIEAL